MEANARLPDETELTPSVEEYVEAVYRLSRSGEAVSTSELAERLQVAAPSVTGMLKRLAARGLVTHRPYRGVALTAAGEEVALALIRRHRLAERLLTEVLGVSWQNTHELACRLEHVMEGEVEERVAKLLEAHDTCPHGHPFDPARPDDRAVSLAELKPPQAARIVRITDESPELLAYLEDRGLMPGADVRLLARDPFEGPLAVETPTGKHAIGPHVAAKIRVLMEAE